MARGALRVDHDEVHGAGPANRLGGDRAVEGGETPVAPNCQGQQVQVGELAVSDAQVEEARVADGDVVRPERVITAVTERRQASDDLGGPRGRW